MTEKTEEQIAKEKAAVEAMRNARANMDAALSRIVTLESALSAARDDLTRTKQYIGAGAYTYGDNNRQTVHAYIDTMIVRASKALAQ